jgi:hypothetical protein
MQVTDAELTAERATLVQATRHIARGERRVQGQAAIAARLRARGHDSAGAERLLQAFEATLAEWKVHRASIVGRIAHLECKNAAFAQPERPGLGGCQPREQANYDRLCLSMSEAARAGLGEAAEPTAGQESVPDDAERQRLRFELELLDSQNAGAGLDPLLRRAPRRKA